MPEGRATGSRPGWQASSAIAIEFLYGSLEGLSQTKVTATGGEERIKRNAVQWHAYGIT